ncbi:MAG TPA: hypothetical protein VFC51_08200 [Chloroflexota bacterium]|nr:hypothetical protein [Chloroflexota bacterium]
MADIKTMKASAHGQERVRVCSGGCPFFSPEYVNGRKLAGMGCCQKHDSQLTVRVGNACIWPRAGVASQRDAMLVAARRASPPPPGYLIAV